MLQAIRSQKSVDQHTPRRFSGQISCAGKRVRGCLGRDCVIGSAPSHLVDGKSTQFWPGKGQRTLQWTRFFGRVARSK